MEILGARRWVQDFFVWPQELFSVDLLETAQKNMTWKWWLVNVACGDVTCTDNGFPGGDNIDLLFNSDNSKPSVKN